LNAPVCLQVNEILDETFLAQPLRAKKTEWQISTRCEWLIALLRTNIEKHLHVLIAIFRVVFMCWQSWGGDMGDERFAS
jgi:hypothetical protein